MEFSIIAANPSKNAIKLNTLKHSSDSYKNLGIETKKKRHDDGHFIYKEKIYKIIQINLPTNHFLYIKNLQ